MTSALRSCSLGNSFLLGLPPLCTWLLGGALLFQGWSVLACSSHSQSLPAIVWLVIICGWLLLASRTVPLCQVLSIVAEKSVFSLSQLEGPLQTLTNIRGDYCKAFTFSVHKRVTVRTTLDNCILSPGCLPKMPEFLSSLSSSAVFTWVDGWEEHIEARMASLSA